MTKTIHFWIIFITFCCPIFAGYPLQVEGLDHGNCWLQEGTSGLKYAHFGKNTAGEINNFSFEGPWNQVLLKLQKAQFNAQAITFDKLHFFCNSFGQELILNFSIHEKKFCWRANISDQNQLKTSSLSRNYSAQNDACDGIQNRIIIIGHEGDQNWLIEKIGQNFSGKVSSITPLGANFIQLKLSQVYLYREDQMAAELKADTLIGPSLNSLEFDSYRYPIGETYLLNIFNK